jgi:hypothetical protein
LKRMGSQWPVWRTVFYLRWIQNPDRGNEPHSKNILNIALPGSPGAVLYQDHYKGCSKKKNVHTCNDVITIQTPRSRWCSLTLGGSEHQRGNNVAGRRIKRKQTKPESWESSREVGMA